jgi:DNA topoisomerase II
MIEKSISNFLNEENKEYAMYVIQRRAIPSVIDGFKISQRKAIDVFRDVYSKDKKLKRVFQWAGIVASSKMFHHSNTSLEDAIVGLGQDYKNNLKLLRTEGQFGSSLVPYAASSRYISCALDPIFFKIFKDFDLLNFLEEEGEIIEPMFFLPIIPMILVNGSSGIAVGFASNILNRDPLRIIDVCIKILQNENYNNVFRPSIKDFKGEVEQDKENKLKWNFYGEYIVKDPETLRNVNDIDTIKITKYCPSMTYEKIEEILSKLEDEKFIYSYENNSSNDINILVKLQKDYPEDLIRKKLKLDSSETENLTVLDEYGNLKNFESTKDIIEYFVSFRLKYYTIRKLKIIEKYNKEIFVLENKILFLKSIINKKLKIGNEKKASIIDQLEKLKIEKLEDSYDYLLSMPIYSLTEELYNKLIKNLEEVKKELKEFSKISEVEMYIYELEELKDYIIKN